MNNDWPTLVVEELSPAEAAAIEGGYLQIVAFLAGCAAAGFNFGYHELGPALFG